MPQPLADTQPYPHRPIAVDISEGRTDPAYMAQNYHTKVPYRAIARYIEHFTRPGELVLDGFCGSGMVGVDAHQTGRRAILCDLSPAATMIAHSLCHPVDLAEASSAFANLLQELERECGWTYRAPDNSILDYVIWSEIFLCPSCGGELLFSEVGFDFPRRRPLRQFACPHCGAQLRPSHLVRAPDENGRTREIPVRVAWGGRGCSRELPPGAEFLSLQEEIERRPIPFWHPDGPMVGRPASSPRGPLPPLSGPRLGWGDM